MGTLDAKVADRALTAAKTLARLGVVRAVYKRAQAMALVMEEAGSDVEAHLFPASALENPASGGFAEYVLRHGTAITMHRDAETRRSEDGQQL